MSLLRRGSGGRERRMLQFITPPIGPYYDSLPTGRDQPNSIIGSMQLPAVWACVNKLSDTVSQLPLHAYRIAPDGSKKRIPDTVFLRKPAADALMHDWLNQVMISLLLRGNAYGRVLSRDRLLYPEQIELLHPDRVKLFTESDGSRTWYYDGDRIPKDQFWHLPGRRLPGTVLGLSPIEYAAVSISAAQKSEDFGLRFFIDGGHPSGILTTEQPVTEDQAKAVKKRYLDNTRGNREPVVMGAGLKYQPVQVAPNESQFLESQKWGVEQIARVFGMTPEDIGSSGLSGASVTYASREQRSIDFLMYSLQPWLTRLENAISANMPGPQYVKFATGALLRTSLWDRYRSYDLGISAGFMTPDEARDFEDMPPLTDEQIALLSDLRQTLVKPSDTGISLGTSEDTN